MVPRPEPVYMDKYNSGAGSMRSPTGITNSIPRPRSPRRPGRDHRGNVSTPRAGGEFGSKDSRVASHRRRSHEEMGHFGGSRSTPEMDIPHRSEPKVVADLLSFNQNVLACASKTQEVSNEYTKRYGPVATKNFGVCLDKTAVAAGVAGDGLTDFAMTAAEVYRQECKSDNRGDDAAFFVDPQQSKEGRGMRQHEMADAENNSLMDSSSASDVDRRDSNSDDIKRNSRPNHQRRKSEPSGLSSVKKGSKHSRFPDAIHVMNDPAQNISPPRAVRTSDARDFDPQADTGNLMEARMELFRLGQESVPQTEVRLARALQDLKRQDKAIDGWKRQLQMTQQHLDETFTELEKTKKGSQEKQFKATEIRARSVQERKKLEDMYEQEVEQNKKLQDSVSNLQMEMSSLKISLRSSRNLSGTRVVPSLPTQTDPSTSGQLMTLKTVIVDLRSQLAEAHAANIEDNSTLNSTGEVDDLRQKLRSAEAELQGSRDNHVDIKRVENEHRQTEQMLRQKLEKIESDARETQTQLEENLKQAVEEENQARAELIKVKYNMQRLERERSRKRLHSAADVDRLNKLLTTTREEASKFEEQLTTQKKSSIEETTRLKQELLGIKDKLAESSSEVATKMTEALVSRSGLEEDLNNLKEEVKDLKQQLGIKSEVISSQAKRISGFELKVKEKAQNYVDPIISSRQMSLLGEEIKFRKANEATLRVDLQLHKSVLAQERAEVTKAEELRSVQSTDDSVTLDQLRRQLDDFKTADEKRVAEEETQKALRNEIALLEKKVAYLEHEGLNKSQDASKFKLQAMEASYKREISTLKARLCDSEAKCNEEKSRAEEERRISKENEAKHVEILEELRQENNTASQDKLRLREELEELRKQMAGHLSMGSGSLNAAAKSEDLEVPRNVKRLRNELALARARLAAARDQTRSFGSTPPSLVQPTLETNKEFASENVPPSPDRSSVASYGSSWAPPPTRKVIERPMLVTPPKLPAVSEAPTPFPCRLTPPSAGNSSFGQNSLLDDDEAEQNISSNYVQSLRATPRQIVLPDVKFQPKSAEKAKVDTSVEELRRQLEESSKRLEKANTRLNGLVETPGIKKAFPASPYRGINRETILTMAPEESDESGVMDEVVTGEFGCIEVKRLRYADV